MTLGKAGGDRDSTGFWQPNDVLVAPNGDIYVAEGHSSNPQSAIARIRKFSKDGRLIATWGKWGKGPDDLDQPGRLLDRVAVQAARAAQRGEVGAVRAAVRVHVQDLHRHVRVLAIG